MSNWKIIFGAAAVLAVAALDAPADTISYAVTVDTLSQDGNSGYIDLQLDPGTFSALPVTATITGFSPAGALNAADPGNGTVGQTSGDLASTLTIANTGGSTNEYTEAIQFGPSLTFDLTLSGAGVNLGGNAAGTSGTNFVLDFFDATQSTYLFSSDPNGNSTSGTDPLWAAGVIDIDNTGLVTTFANPGPDGGATLVTYGPVTATPEPATWSLVTAGLLCMLVFFFHRRRVARP